MEDDLNLWSEDKIREAFNDTGFIDFEGFKDLTSRVLKKVDTEEELREAFRVFDAERTAPAWRSSASAARMPGAIL